MRALTRLIGHRNHRNFLLPHVAYVGPNMQSANGGVGKYFRYSGALEKLAIREITGDGRPTRTRKIRIWPGGH